MLEGNYDPPQDPVETPSDEQTDRIGRPSEQHDPEESKRRYSRQYSPKRQAERRASFERKRRSFSARRQSSSGNDL